MPLSVENCNTVQADVNENRPEMESPGYQATPRERGCQAGFIRRGVVARALMPVRTNGEYHDNR